MTKKPPEFPYLSLFLLILFLVEKSLKIINCLLA